MKFLLLAVPVLLVRIYLSSASSCSDILDLGVAVDVSGSVGQRNIPLLKTTLRSLVNISDISSEGTHVGMIVFGGSAELRFNFSNSLFHKPDALDKEISNINIVSGGTFTYCALSLANNGLFTAAGGDRPDKPNVLLVFTDGKPTQNENKIPDIIQVLESKGVLMVAVGIGDVDINVLQDIAGQNGLTLSSPDFTRLSNSMQIIKDRVCALINETCSTERFSDKIKGLKIRELKSLKEADALTSAVLKTCRNVNFLLLLRMLEDFGTEYANKHLSNKESKQTLRVSDSLVWILQKVPVNISEDVMFNFSGVISSGSGPWFKIPKALFKQQERVVTALMFQDNYQILPKDMHNLIDNEPVEAQLNSSIIAVALKPNVTGELSEDVTLQPRQYRSSGDKRSTLSRCVFWDYSTKTRFNGSWSSKGCSVKNGVCSCNHLTSFAILLQTDEALLSMLNSFTKLLEDAGPEQDSSILTASRRIEDFALRYAEFHLNNNETMTIIRNTSVLQIHKIPPGHSEDITVPKVKNFSNPTAFMMLPSGVFGDKGAYLVSIVYKAVKALQGERHNGDSALLRIGSDILAVAAKNSANELLKRVKITFQTGQKNEPECMFWRFHKRSEAKGRWSDDGCSVSRWNSTHTECLCDHLTHFAVLMQKDPAESKSSSKSNDLALTALSYGGLGLSCLGHTFSIVTLGSFTDFKLGKVQSRLNLVGSLFIAQATYMMGIDGTRFESGCICFAASIMFFFLVAFAWMLIEGVELYFRVTSIFPGEQRRLLKCVLAWGLPLCLVVFSLIYAAFVNGGIHTYVDQSRCWLEAGGVAFWIFVSVIAAITLLNCFIFGQSLRVVIKRKRNNEKTIVLEKLRKVARTCVILFPLLGLTWIIGFVSLAFPHVVLQYVFVILNSVQGMFLFVFNTWKWDEIREGIRMERRQRQIQFQINEAAKRRKAAKENLESPNNMQLKEENDVIEHKDEVGLPEPDPSVEIAVNAPSQKMNDAKARSDDTMMTEDPNDPAQEAEETTAPAINTNTTAPAEKRGDDTKVKSSKCSKVNSDECEGAEKLDVSGGASQMEVPDAGASDSAVYTRAASANRFLPTGAHVWMKVLKKRKRFTCDAKKIEGIGSNSGNP